VRAGEAYGESCRGIIGDARLRPQFERGEKRLLCKVFG
jgi:hypothetical protein